MRALDSLAVVAFLAACVSEAELVAEKQRDIDQMVQIMRPKATLKQALEFKLVMLKAS